ncbi:ATPase, partial [Candidatus Woesearchaeota archaeon]|nr:ATPase [Candidatus Woesearchaeota archaeon]
MASEISLKVAEAIQDDVNKGIVRVDSSLMHQIGVRSGDIVEIEGERKTVGIVDRAYPGDIGLNIIRMDGILRRNAKTGIGEIVKVRKSEVKPAKKVVVAPARRGIMIRAPPELFQQGLLGRA